MDNGIDLNDLPGARGRRRAGNGGLVKPRDAPRLQYHQPVDQPNLRPRNRYHPPAILSYSQNIIQYFGSCMKILLPLIVFFTVLAGISFGAYLHLESILTWISSIISFLISLIVDLIRFIVGGIAWLVLKFGEVLVDTVIFLVKSVFEICVFCIGYVFRILGNILDAIVGLGQHFASGVVDLGSSIIDGTMSIANSLFTPFGLDGGACCLVLIVFFMCALFTE